MNANGVLHIQSVLDSIHSFLLTAFFRAPMLSRSNSVSSRRSLQMQQQLEGEKQYKVNLPDNQVSLDKSDKYIINF